jgi:hypothetical protein
MELMTTTTYEIPKGGNRACGSAAIAYAMRGTTDEAAAILRRVTGRQRVRGIHDMELIAAMRTVGVTLRWACDLNWIFLGDLMAEIQDSHDEFVIVLNSVHYAVIHKGMVFDNMHRVGVPFSQCEYKHLPVIKVWRITRQPAVIQ